ncbi:MAG: adenylate/guanylate cyclase domain-containing protein [Termitinemataceae bacterium]|nr:MAG: adenylate/guanylate cyclase domain-containing protein [Termitinemataceae bacterium]
MNIFPAAGNKRGLARVKGIALSFPIRFKLILIITFLLLVSLGLISFIAAFFVHRDVRRTAWENNFSINEMSASAAEVQMNGIISKVSVFLEDLDATGFLQNEEAVPEEAPAVQTAELQNGSIESFFFKENPEIAAIFTRFLPLENETGKTFYNHKFLISNDIRSSMIDAFMTVQNRAVERAADTTALLNAAPALGGVPVLALLFHWQGSRSEAVGVVFFSSESITAAFGTGTNSTVFVNSYGDVLVCSQAELINEGANFSNISFVKKALQSDETRLEEIYRDSEGRGIFGNSKRINPGNSIVITTIPSDVVFEGIRTTTIRNIYFSAGVLFLSILFFWFFAKSILKPLKNLTLAVKAIENGEYHIKLYTKSQDETSLLTHSVVSMSHALENFENFTNKEIARLAREGKLETSGDTKNITMFFSDIRSFTAISEKLSPNEVIEFLNEYMERMVSCVLITGGAIDKFIGDAVMAYWGVINTAGSEKKDAFNGVKAALLMRASLACFNTGRGGYKRPVIRIGCGLNSGTVVAGQIGSEEHVVFTVIGETVSLADRAETLNKPFGTEIIITERTYNLIKDFFITEKMGVITEAGEKIGIYTVINIKDGEESFALISDLKKLPGIDIKLALKFAGPEGPKTLVELRSLLNIPAPDLSSLNLDEEEKKYSVVNA